MHPKHDIKVPFEWVEVDALLDIPSMDFDGTPLRHHMQDKRDYSYADLIVQIESVGLKCPVYVDEGRLRNGHHRVVAIHDLGYSHVPVTKYYHDGWLTSGGEG